MVTLIAGLVVFFGVHLISTNQELRGGLVARFGEQGFKIGFALVSLIGFVVMVYGYHKMQMYVGSKNPVLWYPPDWTRPVASLLMLPALIFLVAAYVPSRMRFYLRHPMLLSVKIWALAHLMVNGTVAALVLFSSFLAFAVYDRISLKKRGVGAPDGDAQASFLNDVMVVVIGIGLYAFMVVWGHEYLIGKRLL